ncbi:3'(2'),5'-bisphosphate nucleotidase CysQ [Brevundimonas sp. 2R-24]|uniref:3'(2'),5'-bisphosphate nucleotidase CysQ n=1 Tax=Peiella sedimenti TaxID=3061083 RepID=A0ABT8SLE4_9CAUL|nr:3'(2'),5'-bisphosphate nucleotidase CysQ [Caulobacteraceae bacterium XZ-24]
MSTFAEDVTSGRIGARLAEIAQAAAEVILPYWRAGGAVTIKADESPVTEADHAAEALILERLAALYPGVAVVAEEQSAAGLSPEAVGEAFFLVDPLDGTRAFVAGREFFVVSIGLAVAGRAAAGALAAPALGVVWHTGEGGAFRRRFDETEAAAIQARPLTPGQGAALVSHTLTPEQAERIAASVGCAAWRGMDSAVKFGLIAEGAYDAYPRPGRTMEWDTCAGEAVLTAAGGRVLDEAGRPMRYGRAADGWENPGFLAEGVR